MAHDEVVFDVTPGRFDEEVIDASAERPIVVDFWAEWCAPCRSLGPVIEQVVRSYEGRVRLARLDVEADPQAASRFGVRGIPAVKVFRGGRVVGEFVGALPEPEVRRALEAALPSEADELLAEGDRLIEDGRVEGAARRYGEALQREPDHAGALLRLGTMAVEQGKAEKARGLLERIEEHAAEHEAARAMLGRLEFAETCRRAGGREACARRAEEEPEDPDALYEMACCHAADEDYEAALERLLQVLRRDRAYRDGAAREAMVRIFTLVGPRSELADAYRRKLAGVLY